jgi:hypothetical protein
MWTSVLTKINWAVGSVLFIVGLFYFITDFRTDYSSEKEAAAAIIAKIVSAQRRHYQENNRYIYFSARRDKMQEGFRALNLNPQDAFESGFDFDAGVGENNKKLIIRALTPTQKVASGSLAPLIYQTEMIKGAEQSGSWL